MTIIEADTTSADGRTLHFYDTGAQDDTRLTVFWHHGSPNIGLPPEPLFNTSERLGIRWVSHDRPDYGGSSSLPSRNVASVATDVARIADDLGIDMFAVMGHSGGGSNALACGALLPGRVLSVACISGMAPFTAEGLDWFEGFGSSGAAELRAAASGRDALEKHLEQPNGPSDFIDKDEAALAGEWSWFMKVVNPAVAGGMGGFIDDDLAGVNPWGFDPAAIVAPVLFMHGGQDRVVPASHAEWLSRHCPTSELLILPDEGHISIMNSASRALDWLAKYSNK